jgi:hypothetical protein
MIMAAHKNSLPRSFLLAATLTVGFATLWGLLVIWLGSTIGEAWPGKTRPPREDLQVTTDGTLLIRSYRFDNLSRMTYRDLNGRVHDDVKGTDMVRPVSLPDEYKFSTVFSQAGWLQRMNVYMDEREPDALWYFVHDGKEQGSGYFVGYERVSNRLIGFIGLAGFRARPVPPDERIPVRGGLMLGSSYWSSEPSSIYTSSYRYWVINRPRPGRGELPPRLVHVPCGNRLRVVDLDARTVTTVFEAPLPIGSVGVPALASYAGGDPAKERPVLVRAGPKVYRLDHKYNVTSVFTIPAEVDRRGSVTWYEAGNGQAVAEFAGPRRSGGVFGDNVTRSVVYRIANDGAIRDSFKLALQNGSNPASEQAQFSMTALALPAPAVLLAAGSLKAANDPAQGFATALGAMLKRSWPLLVGVLSLSAVLAAITWRRGRACGLSRRERAMWAVFVLLFGVPACVGFLLHRGWPVREPCPHCHARSPRDRDACAECGTPFPAPVLKGTEIFA